MPTLQVDLFTDECWSAIALKLHLTPAVAAVARLVARGSCIKDLEQQLGKSRSTVELQRLTAMRAMHAVSVEAMIARLWNLAVAWHIEHDKAIQWERN